METDGFLSADDLISTLRSLSNNDKIPICFYALGSLFRDAKGGDSVSKIINNFPPWYGYLLNDLTSKNLSNFLNQLRRIVDNSSNSVFVNRCLEVLRCSQTRHKHDDSSPTLSKGVPCSVCFAVPSSPTVVDSNTIVRDGLRSIYQRLVSHCVGTQEEVVYPKLHELICQQSFDIAHVHDKTAIDQFLELEQKKKQYAAYVDTVVKNVEAYNQNLESHAAQLFYGLGLTISQINRLDHIFFCSRRVKNTVVEEVKKLPSLNHIKSCNPFLVPQDLFEKYISHVNLHKEEPVFSQLGLEFKLYNSEGNSNIAILAKYAKSVCYNCLLLPENEKAYTEVLPILATCVNHGHYKAFPLVADIKIPRLPSVKIADAQVDALCDSGEILLGSMQPPTMHSKWNIQTLKNDNYQVHSRKVALLDIIKRSLEFQDNNNYLRGQKPEYYNILPINDVRRKLQDYNIVLETQVTPHSEDFLRQTLKKAETTRLFTIWYDHAIVLNQSYIMFTVSAIFLPQLYYSDKVGTRALQKIIEEPQLYLLGISSSNTKSEESFREARLQDLATLSGSLTSPSGVDYKAQIRFIIGDCPVRNVELGQNKCGWFRLSTVHQRFPISDLSYNKIMSLNHMDLKACADHANKGKFFENPDNIGKNLQVELKENPFSLAKIRKVLFRKNESKDSVSAKLYEEIGGRRAPPILLSDNPSRTCAEMNSPLVEVIPFEPLHDTKGVIEKSFKHVPGKNKIKNKLTDIQKTVSDIIFQSCDHSKDKNSAEDRMKQLIGIVQRLQERFFPHVKEDGFTTCGSCKTIIFMISRKQLCEKCLYFTYYRSLLEISIYSYKDDTKRDAATSLRLHNLIFIFYKCVKEIQKIDKVQNIDKLQNCVYFFDLIFYFGVTFELHNPLSYHAGKQEDKFRQVNIICDNNTNRQQFSPLFLKTVFKRIAVMQHYRDPVETVKHSDVSKAITKFYQASPELEISFNGDLLDNDISFSEETSTSREDFLSHLGRISNFLVSNKNLRFIKVVETSSGWAMHFPIHKECQTKCLNLDAKSCLACQAKKFPPFGINNVSNSSIKKVLDCKKQLYSLYIVNKLLKSSTDLEDSEANLPSKRFKSSLNAKGTVQVDFKSSFMELLEQESVPQLRQLLPPESTDDITSAISITGISMSSLLNSLSMTPTPADYDKLKYSDIAKVSAKLLNLVCPDLIRLDVTSNNMSTLSTHIATNHATCSRMDLINQDTYKKIYGAQAKICAVILGKKLESIEGDIVDVSATIEACHYTHEEDSPVIYKITSKNRDYNLLKKLTDNRMAIIHVKNILESEHKTYLQDI